MGVNLTDVPDRYDVVFQLNDGTKYGFLLADSVESNLPFRTHKALYSYSPTFLERQNVSNEYGDNFQDFFLTGSQDDFSLGEQQKFFRVNDPNRSRRYFAGLSVDPVTTPGNVTLTTKLTTVSAPGANPICANNVLGGLGGTTGWFVADGTNLSSVLFDGTTSLVGAHGCGAPPTYGVVDGNNLYLGYEGSLSAGIRKWNGSSFTTFSSTQVTAAVFNDNILFGYQASTDSFISFDASGNPTTQFQWKNADGSVNITGIAHIGMCAFGGGIYIVRQLAGTELWIYDGSGVRKVADLPEDFSCTYYSGGQGVPTVCVSQGIVFIAGYVTYANNTYRPTVYFYVNGSLGKLWESQTISTSGRGGAIVPFGNGVVFLDPITNNLMQYNVAAGGVHTIGNPGAFGAMYASPKYSEILIGNTKIYGASTSYNSTGYIQTSQYDFDNTLGKIIRGLKVDADIPANTSIDLAYQLDGCGGTYTTLQTGITSGTEYLLPASTSAHSISVKVTLNSATGSATPTLKRVYVRAAPVLQQFRKREYLFDLSGGLREDIGKSSRRNRDGTPYPYDPKTAANNLRTIATQTIPFTVQDRFDQFTCIADLQENSEGYDGFAIYEIRPEVFIGRINLREV